VGSVYSQTARGLDACYALYQSTRALNGRIHASGFDYFLPWVSAESWLQS